MVQGEQLDVRTLAAMVRAGAVKFELLSADVRERIEAFERGDIEADDDQPGLFEGASND